MNDTEMPALTDSNHVTNGHTDIEENTFYEGEPASKFAAVSR